MSQSKERGNIQSAKEISLKEEKDEASNQLKESRSEKYNIIQQQDKIIQQPIAEQRKSKAILNNKETSTTIEQQIQHSKNQENHDWEIQIQEEQDREEKQWTNTQGKKRKKIQHKAEQINQ